MQLHLTFFMGLYIIFGVERERENNFFMEQIDVEVNSTEEAELFPEVRSRHYDSRIKDADLMHRFLEESSDFEKIKMYQYVLKKAKYLERLGTEEAKEMIPFCWLSSMELEQTDALKKFFSGEITQEMIDEYDKAEAAILAAKLKARNDERKTLRYQMRKFLGLRPTKKTRNR